ncbi:MAG: tRNA 2-thiouridine(34) synthase MnmA [Ruminococcus sp.]|jgi:tRNA-specific 2-thiouridylase|nr:tRNA 2-thiouridine(34) synthase MnmA [Ruminococcus sp.]
MPQKEKILIGMSGGVDSSVAAFLLSREYETVGATMKLVADDDTAAPVSGKICCTADDAFDAKAVCFKLGIAHYVFNFTREFDECVIADFADEYKNGRTPNPCIVCNKALKFGKLLLRAKEIGCAGVATGHYARLGKIGGRTLLKKAADIKKDQTYFLYSLTGEQLSKTVFPLGGLTKEEVREIAEEQGLVTAKKAESQDICFVRDGDYAAFLTRRGVLSPEGDFTDKNGNILGRHKGIIHYTKGQRKGLGAFGSPKYVTGIDAESNRVILGDSDDLFGKTVTIKNINLTAADRLETPINCAAKIRYNAKESPCTAVQTDSDTITITFDEPQKSATPGQAAVLYDGDLVIGGGIIV